MTQWQIDRFAWYVVILAILSALVWDCASRAHAQDNAVAIAADKALSPGKLMVHEGVRGWWWPLDTALVLRAEHLALPEVSLALEKAEAAIARQDEQLRNEAVRLGLCDAEREAVYLQLRTVTEQRDEQAERADAAERKLKAWYRRPELWLGLGAAAISALWVWVEVADDSE